MQPGTFCVVIPLAAGVAVMLIRAANADTRAEKIGRIALACGIAGFPLALFGGAIGQAGRPEATGAFGAFVVLAAVAAVVGGVWALRLRRHTLGVDARIPVAALLCGGANLFCGTGLAVVGSGSLTPTTGEAWDWTDPVHGYTVTVPTEHWRQVPNRTVPAEFAGTRPALSGMVAPSRPAATDAEFEAALAYGRTVKADAPSLAPDERTGTNLHGHPYWLYTGDVSNDDKPYFFGVSVTRVRGRAVVLLFEAPHRMTSRLGREQEARSHRAQAGLFLGSVR